MKLNRRLFRFENRIEFLEKLIQRNSQHYNNWNEREYIIERAVMQLQTEWNLFVRGLILDSATGKYENQTGQIASMLTKKKISRKHVKHMLIAQYKKRATEPDWHLPQEAIRAASLLQLSNLSDISNCLGVSPWPLDDLRYVRNYIAHQSAETIQQLRRSGMIGSKSKLYPKVVIFQYHTSGNQYYMVWCHFMRTIASQLVR